MVLVYKSKDKNWAKLQLSPIQRCELLLETNKKWNFDEMIVYYSFWIASLVMSSGEGGLEMKGERKKVIELYDKDWSFP